jgi:5'-nucleotidase
MKILLTNDDGIDAPGLAALARAVNGSFEKIIAAPHIERSGCSHSTTTDRPIQFQQLGADRFSVEGTPADCVRVALHQFPGEISFILAGINSGGNLGVDVYHSGTVAAVREAALHGVPGIALSHYRNRRLTTEDWRRAAAWCAPIIHDILSHRCEPGVIWNINRKQPTSSNVRSICRRYPWHSWPRRPVCAILANIPSGRAFTVPTWTSASPEKSP